MAVIDAATKGLSHLRWRTQQLLSRGMGNRRFDNSAGSLRTIGPILGVVVGGAVGFLIAFLLYGWLNPVLEARRDWLRELQGVLFTLIPLFTVAGSALGWRLGKARTRSSPR